MVCGSSHRGSAVASILSLRSEPPSVALENPAPTLGAGPQHTLCGAPKRPWTWGIRWHGLPQVHDPRARCSDPCSRASRLASTQGGCAGTRSSLGQGEWVSQVHSLKTCIIV